MDYQPINFKSEYSFLKSLIKIKDYINWGVNNGCKWISLIDNFSMYGNYKFYQLCKKNNIKPILGLEFKIKFKQKIINVAVIAKKLAGYKNLIKLSSLINEGQSTKIINLLDLEPLVEDLIIVFIYHKNSVIENFKDLIKYFPNNNIFIGLQYYQLDQLSLLKKYYVNKLIWFSPICQLNNQPLSALKILKAIKKQTTLDSKDILQNKNTLDPLSVPSQFNSNKSDWEILKNNLSVLINQVKNYTIPTFKFKENFIKYPIPNNEKPNIYLKNLCLKKIKFIFKNHIPQNYLKVLNHELEIIDKMGFNDYFLVVADYVNFARKNNILVGPGRGSAASSLVAYSLNITDVDPIKFHLFFERFLNIERKSLPDIDIDVEDIHRDKIIEYLIEKYGYDHVGYINTFQKMGLKMIIRDLGRVLNINSNDIDNMCKILSFFTLNDFKDQIKTNKVLKLYVQKYPVIFDNLNYFYGLPRQSGTHAAGIILTQNNLVNYTPTAWGINGILRCQYDMKDLALLGLVKIDILGLKNLNILHNILILIKQNFNQDINLNDIALNDSKTFELLRQGYNQGIFQLESEGMTNLLKKLKVKSFEDIIITTSLYRPGPQDNINLFIKRKFQNYQMNYGNETLNKILNSTYGIIIYQEQVMQIAQCMANFSLGKADILVRAMSKKNIQLMINLKKDFVIGCQKNNFQEPVIEKYWNLIAKFAAYGFNRAHGVSYSLVSYWLAYFKANYYSSFITALLDSVIGSRTKTQLYLQEAKTFGLKTLPPNVNQPSNFYQTKGNHLFLPLTIIKQIGKVFYNAIAKEYAQKNFFTNIFDFCVRLNRKGLNYETFQALCYSGALDCFGLNRITLDRNYQIIKNYIKLIETKIDEEYSYDFSLVLKPNLQKYSNDLVKITQKELHYLGFYLKFHPIAYVRNKYNFIKNTVLIKELNLKFSTATILGQITNIHIIKDKNNQKMAFITLQDESGVFHLTMFSSLYKKHETHLFIGQIILTNIKLQTYGNELKGIINYFENIVLEN